MKIKPGVIGAISRDCMGVGSRNIGGQGPSIHGFGSGGILTDYPVSIIDNPTLIDIPTGI